MGKSQKRVKALPGFDPGAELGISETMCFLAVSKPSVPHMGWKCSCPAAWEGHKQ